MGLMDLAVGAGLGALGPPAPPAGGKACLLVEGESDAWELQFNPENLSISKSAGWDGPPAPGQEAPQLKYTASNSAEISFSFYLDVTRVPVPKGKGSTPSSVLPATDRLFSLLRPNADLPDADASRNSGRPPLVTFAWGEQNSVLAAVTSVKVDFTYFSREGLPLRAKVDLSLKQYQPETKAPYQNPTSHTPYPHTVHYLVPGETLDRIAARRYNDPTRWRAIALANGITNPMALDPTKPMIIPDNPGVFGA